jgi:hypothetical protein
MYRVGLVTNSGIPKSDNFSTKEQAETWILEIAEKEGIRLARIKNLDTGEEERVF